MGAGVEHQQFQLVIMLVPNQKPVGLYVTFPLAFAITMKKMRAVFDGADFIHQMPIFLKNSSLFSYEFTRPSFTSSSDCS